MSLSNTRQTYGSIAKVFHWLTALLILSVIPIGIIAQELPFETSEQLTRKALLFSIHKTLGVTIFFTALARIVWAISQPKPGLLNADHPTEAMLAEIVHWLLYGSLLLVPLSGWIHHAATTGFAPIWWPFGQSLLFVSQNDVVAGWFAGLHLVLIIVLVGALVLHIAGTLKHHILDKDNTLRRMLPNAPEIPPLPQQHLTVAPVIAALAIWGAALGIGAWAGTYNGDGAAQNVQELEEVKSQWVVQDGTIEFSVVQFGSTVKGSFSDWTAAITFDPEIQNDLAGTVDTTISIGSLTLGSVTAQALGPDFFSSEAFPTAQFVADILSIPDGYVAEGTLTIKDHTIPITLHFDLSTVDDVAEMGGTLSLDRRDFGIGANLPDETSLGFNIDVSIALTATKPAE